MEKTYLTVFPATEAQEAWYHYQRKKVREHNGLIGVLFVCFFVLSACVAIEQKQLDALTVRLSETEKNE